MSNSSRNPSSADHASIDALSQLTLNPCQAGRALQYVAGLSPERRKEFLALADSHHVIIRALAPIRGQVAGEFQQWAEDGIGAERARIMNALPRLEAICRELEQTGAPVAVMKSLDHWPDLGNDLDLYTIGAEQTVIRTMRERFGARVESQSWGDRLARKWNFAVPGLPEAVEIHVQRLGQTGEQVEMARRFVTRRVSVTLDGHSFFVPAPEERVVVATLQRMYRHFYFRVCDIVNAAALVETRALDYMELAAGAELGGIWPGVATYLCVVSDYVWKYRGIGLRLPPAVTAKAKFGGDRITVGGKFLRVPKVPEAAGLYFRQLARNISEHRWAATARLSLLPPLASAAAVAYAITGSDKGVW